MSGSWSSEEPSDCGHPRITFESSIHAADVGFRRVAVRQRVAASTAPKSKNPNQPGERKGNGKARANFHPNQTSFHDSFPAPLVLPQDDLALDKTYPPQSLRSWLRLKDRNELKHDKNIIYVAAPPEIAKEIGYISTWSQLQYADKAKNHVSVPDIQEIMAYLAAFYHGVPVRPLPTERLRFTDWEDEGLKSKRAKPAPAKSGFIGLNTSTEVVRIRTRASKDNIFPWQLNLDDLLDVAIGILPHDAYALLLLVHQDLYENPDDVFVCGRAYGGSRVAVVSTARYHPSLDGTQGVVRQHSWPASHCSLYLQQSCAAAREISEPRRKKSKVRKPNSSQVSPDQISIINPDHHIIDTPLQAAIYAHNSLPLLENTSSPKMLSGLWLGRVCRTVSHELGHCFGLDHCVYYACSMQGSASVAEDSRQPPYLCPIDLAKLLNATSADAEQRYLALLNFCQQHVEAQMFVTFAAWLQAQLSAMHSVYQPEQRASPEV